MSAVARNLGLVMRSLFGFGTARSLQAEGDPAEGLYFALLAIVSVTKRLIAVPTPVLDRNPQYANPAPNFASAA